MNKPKALIILSPGFAANENDTTCIPSQQVFVKALKKYNPGLDIIVISFQYPFVNKVYNWHGVQIIALGGKDKGSYHRIITWQMALSTLKRLKGIYQPVGLLSFWMGECAFIGNRFAKRNHLLHYTWLLGQDAKAGNKYVKRIKPNADSVIALSDFLAREFETNYGVKPRYTIPVGIDISYFDEPAAQKDIDIIGAGSLIPLKQYNLFIDVIKSLVIKFPDIKTVICGKGPEQQRLQQQIVDLGLENNVELKGELPHHQVLALMQSSKIFLHTSVYEGYGNVLSEALYAGCEVVSLVNPMDKRPPQHHVADSAQELPQAIAVLLADRELKHQSVLTDSIQTIAARVSGLFL